MEKISKKAEIKKVGKGVSASIQRFTVNGIFTKTIYIPSNIRIDRKDDYVNYLQFILATADRDHLEKVVKFYQSKKDKTANELTNATADKDTALINTLNGQLAELSEKEENVTSVLKECEEFLLTISDSATTFKSTLSTYDLQFFTNLLIATKNKKLTYSDIDKQLDELIQKLSNEKIPEDFENVDYKAVKKMVVDTTKILNGVAITGELFTPFTPKVTAEDMQSVLSFQYANITTAKDFTYIYNKETKKQLAIKIYAIAFKDILTDRNSIKPNKQN